MHTYCFKMAQKQKKKQAGLSCLLVFTTRSGNPKHGSVGFLMGYVAVGELTK